MLGLRLWFRLGRRMGTRVWLGRLGMGRIWLGPVVGLQRVGQLVVQPVLVRPVVEQRLDLGAALQRSVL